MTRSQIRGYQKKLRDGLTPEEHHALSLAIMERLMQTEEYQGCSRLFVYVSFRNEADTHELIRRALASGKEVFIPRVEPQGMEFYRINQLEGLSVSSYGIQEPPADKDKRFPIEMIIADYHDRPFRNLMLLPGLAFDPLGNRLGYGAGYYDRYLVGEAKNVFYKAALAFDFQVMDKIEANEHDVKADMIVTPSRMIRIV